MMADEFKRFDLTASVLKKISNGKPDDLAAYP